MNDEVKVLISYLPQSMSPCDNEGSVHDGLMPFEQLS